MASASPRKKSTTARPANAKKPADRKPPAPPKPSVKKTDEGWEVTHQGITVTVAIDALDDFELLDDLEAVEVRAEGHRMPSILRRLVGEDGYQVVMEGLRDKDTGRVKASTASEFVMELFGAINPN